jgi:hypothetical protein
MHIDPAVFVCIRPHDLLNCWTDLDEISYERHAIGVYPKIIIFNFLHSVIPTWQANRVVRWDQH